MAHVDTFPEARHWPGHVALAVCVVTLLEIAAGLTMGILTGARGSLFLPILLAMGAAMFTGGGAVLASRHPQNPEGWILLLIGSFQGLSILTSGYTLFATWHAASPRPLGVAAAWVSSWAYVPSIGLLVTLLLLLFPDGKPLTPRWSWAVRTAIAGIALETVGAAVSQWQSRFEILLDPAADISPAGAWGAVAAIGLALIGASAIAAIISVALRWRRARGDERQQLRWFAFGAAVLILGFFLALTIDRKFYVLGAGFLAIPITVTISVLKYRLYDLDIVVKKTVVLAIVVGVLTALYLGAVALTAGGVVGGLLIALTFRPVRDGARRIADRLVYGKRATPYEVLAEFSERIGTTYGDDDVVPRMAQLLREATGASVARVWLWVDGGFTTVAAVPQESPPAPWPPGGAEVRYHGALLGGLSVEMPANDPLDPVRTKLILDLAGQAGPVLANVLLIEELRASRRRIVSAQDERAKKLERNIHDGAQQQLVALAVKQRLAAGLIGKDEGRLRSLLEDLVADTNEALGNLRDLARGIYPPLLADQGLAAALEAQARKSVIPVIVESDDIGRRSQDVEAAVYFCCLEALQNIGKYAEASGATVRLSEASGTLTFEVRDDGDGFDPASTGYGTGLQGMADRLDALGGSLEVRSEPDHGTTIVGRVPTL